MFSTLFACPRGLRGRQPTVQPKGPRRLGGDRGRVQVSAHGQEASASPTAGRASTPPVAPAAPGVRCPPLVLLLDAGGEALGTLCAEAGARGAARRGGVVVVLGGSKGLRQSDIADAEARAEAAGARVRRVSLGRTTLLASQCIAIVHHYLDALMLAHEDSDSEKEM